MISDVAAALQGQIRYEALLWKLAPGAFPGTFDPGVLLQCICVTSPWWNEVAAILMFFDAPVQYEANTFFVINLKILGSIRRTYFLFFFPNSGIPFWYDAPIISELDALRVSEHHWRHRKIFKRTSQSATLDARHKSRTFVMCCKKWQHNQYFLIKHMSRSSHAQPQNLRDGKS
jgi:hypothetical protein